jgi:hypothetical protein
MKLIAYQGNNDQKQSEIGEIKFILNSLDTTLIPQTKK